MAVDDIIIILFILKLGEVSFLWCVQVLVLREERSREGIRSCGLIQNNKNKSGASLASSLGRHHSECMLTADTCKQNYDPPQQSSQN